VCIASLSGFIRTVQNCIMAVLLMVHLGNRPLSLLIIVIAALSTCLQTSGSQLVFLSDSIVSTKSSKSRALTPCHCRDFISRASYIIRWYPWFFMLDWQLTRRRTLLQKSCSTPTSVYLDCSSFALQVTYTYLATRTVASCHCYNVWGTLLGARLVRSIWQMSISCFILYLL